MTPLYMSFFCNIHYILIILCFLLYLFFLSLLYYIIKDNMIYYELYHLILCPFLNIHSNVIYFEICSFAKKIHVQIKRKNVRHRMKLSYTAA